MGSRKPVSGCLLWLYKNNSLPWASYVSKVVQVMDFHVSFLNPNEKNIPSLIWCVCVCVCVCVTKKNSGNDANAKWGVETDAADMTLLAVVSPVIRQFNRRGLVPITKVENDEIRNKIKLQFTNWVVYDPKLCALITVPLLYLLDHNILVLQGARHKSCLVQLCKNSLSSIPVPKVSLESPQGWRHHLWPYKVADC